MTPSLTSTTSSSDKVKAAQGRLDAALERLQLALTSRPSGQGEDDQSLISEINSLKAENADLKRRLSEASNRVDGAIGRVKTLLGEA